MFAWLFGKREVKPKPRYVLLVYDDDEIHVCVVHESESGWIARPYKGRDYYVILNPDGTITGDKSVVGWLPHKGWSKDAESKEDISC